MRRADWLPLLVAALEDDLFVHDHVADHPLAGFGKGLGAVAEQVVGDDDGVQLAREGEQEVVGVRACGRLPDLAKPS